MALSTKNVFLLLAGLALLALLAWLLIALQPLLVALTISALVAYLLSPPVKRLAHRLKGNRPLAAALIYIMVLAIFTGLFVLLGAVALDQWPRVQHELGEALAVMEGWLTRPFPFFGFQLNPTIILESLNTAWSNALSTLTIGENGVLSGLALGGLLGALLVVPLLATVKVLSRFVYTRLGFRTAAEADIQTPTPPPEPALPEPPPEEDTSASATAQADDNLDSKNDQSQNGVEQSAIEHDNLSDF